MKHCESIKSLRPVIGARTYKDIERKPGVYRWWFEESNAKTLIKPLGKVDVKQIQSRKIDGKTYLALYFGIANKSLLQRLRWHILDKHTDRAVEHGLLSTLRQTLSALLGKDMTQAEASVNALMDAACDIEFDYVESSEAAHAIEDKELATNYYPLNIQGNKIVASEITKCLKDLRKQHKK